jgi:uncharacterized protein (TIGR02145 family)
MEWGGLITGACCEYDNNAAYIGMCGRLYNWYAVNDVRNIAPKGWHVPTDAEWKQLEMYLGMSQAQADDEGWRGTDEGNKLKETGATHWNGSNEGATNETGFSAVPAGRRGSELGLEYVYGFMVFSTCFWTSTEIVGNFAWSRYLHHNDPGVRRVRYCKPIGCSVRCVKGGRA